jgi:hypothetical protein
MEDNKNIQRCTCGHSIDSHIESNGDEMVAGECVECDCQIYDEEGSND